MVRCTAILLVTLGHFAWMLPEDLVTLKAYMHMMAFLGVEVFFILSGFLIGRILWRTLAQPDFQRKDILYFWIRRWFRTLPNYYLILLVNIILVAILSLQSIPDDLWKYFLFVQNLSDPIPNFFTESWSLSVEEFAYILGPLALLLISLVTNKRRLAFLLIVLGIILLGIFLKWQYHQTMSRPDYNFWNDHLKLVVIYRLDSIYYGVLGAYAFERVQRILQMRKVLFVLGLVLLMLTMFILAGRFRIETNAFFWDVLYLPLVSFSVLLMMPFFAMWKLEKSNILARWVHHTSLISYSMYLLHYSIVLYIFKHWFGTLTENIMAMLGVLTLYIACVYLFASLLYTVYEKPMMDLRDHPKLKKWLGA